MKYLLLVLRGAATGLWLLLALPTFAQVQELTHAHAIIDIDGKTLATEVRLPYHWDRRNEGRSGTAEFDIPFALGANPEILYGVYFRRLGNAYEIWFNGSLLQRNGDLASSDSADFAKAPRYLVVPHHLVRQQNSIKVRIRADGGRRGGLASPVFGPEAEVRELFETEHRWRVNGSFAVVVLSILVGVSAILLWFTQVDTSQAPGRGRDDLYLFAGVAELAWALRVSDAIIEQPLLGWTAWGTLQATALAVWLGSMAVFCMTLAGWDKGANGPRVKSFLLWLVAMGGAAAFASFQFDRTWLLTAWFIVASLFFAGFGVFFIASAYKSKDRMHHLVAVALAANVVTGLRDALVFRIADSYGDNSLTRYSSVLFGLVLGYVLLSRFKAATAQVRDLMQNLERKLLDRETELSRSYQRLELLARAQERAAERARIVRDMHDGVGSHITSAIRQLESAKASRADVLQTLRGSLDHLKLSIDAMNLPAGDVTALLANLRYRLDPRFAASDIELRWAVDVVKSLPALDPAGMHHLQFIVFEALSNVLQHARATVLRIQASALGSGVVVRLADNGIGFNVDAPRRKGLVSMHERAAAIGAQLSIRSSAAGTVIEIAFP